MDENKTRADLPDEALGEVAGGWSPIMTYKKRFVCDKCGFEVFGPCTVGMVRDDQGLAQGIHNSRKGKTRTCTDGTMEYKP